MGDLSLPATQPWLLDPSVRRGPFLDAVSHRILQLGQRVQSEQALSSHLLPTAPGCSCSLAQEPSCLWQPRYPYSPLQSFQKRSLKMTVTAACRCGGGGRVLSWV